MKIQEFNLSHKCSPACKMLSIFSDLLLKPADLDFVLKLLFRALWTWPIKISYGSSGSLGGSIIIRCIYLSDQHEDRTQYDSDAYIFPEAEISQTLWVLFSSTDMNTHALELKVQNYYAQNVPGKMLQFLFVCSVLLALVTSKQHN